MTFESFVLIEASIIESVRSEPSCPFPPIPAIRIFVVPSFFSLRNSHCIMGVKCSIVLFGGVIDFERKFHAKTPINARVAIPIITPTTILLIHFLVEGVDSCISRGSTFGERVEEGSFLVLNADMRLIIEKKVIFSKEKWVFHK